MPVIPIRTDIPPGQDAALIVRLPPMVVDETASAVLAESERRLPHAQHPGLILDFAGVQLINSIGITCLLQLDEMCRTRGGRMVLADVPPRIAQFLATLRLDRRLRAVATVADALAMLAAERTTPD